MSHRDICDLSNVPEGRHSNAHDSLGKTLGSTLGL